jgi:hypothetical protein
MACGVLRISSTFHLTLAIHGIPATNVVSKLCGYFSGISAQLLCLKYIKLKHLFGLTAEFIQAVTKQIRLAANIQYFYCIGAAQTPDTDVMQIFEMTL